MSLFKMESKDWDKRAFALRDECRRRYIEGCCLQEDGLKVEEWLAKQSTQDLFKIMTVEWPVMSWEWRYIDELFNRIPEGPYKVLSTLFWMGVGFGLATFLVWIRFLEA